MEYQNYEIVYFFFLTQIYFIQEIFYECQVQKFLDFHLREYAF